jgi:DNA polymerase-3 subunit epsilon
MRLAFVDVETTGVDPLHDRVTEIGVVTVSGTHVEHWTTWVNPGRRESGESRRCQNRLDAGIRDAPTFTEIASDLGRRLDGRLFIAHNARFDYSFLKTEFERAGLNFDPRVLCSLMLSRRLYPDCARHDLDSLIERHALAATTRHRALPDADLIWQFWQTAHRSLSGEAVTGAINTLLAGPLLPPHLDPSLIDRLPDAPGVYVVHDQDGTPIHAGNARNLRLHVQAYFRLDRTSAKALAISHRISNITWTTTRGPLGAQLRLASASAALAKRRRNSMCEGYFSWRIVPDNYPALELVSLSDSDALIHGYMFGIFESRKKAHNALHRMAAQHRLCHSLLAVSSPNVEQCLACAGDGSVSACGSKVRRLRELTRAIAALCSEQLPPWPYDGAIGIRERSDLHVIDNWRFLGTATRDHEVSALLEAPRPAFEPHSFRLLSRKLRKLPPRRIVILANMPRHPVDPTH